MKFYKRVFTLLLAVILCAGSLSVTAQAAGELMYGIGFVNATSLRLRSEPNTASSIITTAPRNECVAVISKTGNWYKVNYNLQVGYMHENYLNVLKVENAELGYGKVTGDRVNMRSGASTSNKVVSVASKGDKAYIIGLNNGWYKVIYGSNICYIRSDYLELTEYPYENQKSPNSPKFFRLGKSTGVKPSASALNGSTGSGSNSSGIVSGNTGSSAPSADGQAILNKAKQYLGAPYVYGGASPSGFDCSGFVYYVLKSLGYSPYRTPADQYQMGTYVSKANLQPGDIVFFHGTYASGISHVGIYAGNGQFIHAPNSRSVVSYSDLTSGYWANHYYGARRMSN